jgi:hypothetical protein
LNSSQFILPLSFALSAEAWAGKVPNPFKLNSKELTDAAGMSQTITAAKVTFSIPSGKTVGQPAEVQWLEHLECGAALADPQPTLPPLQSRCLFTYSKLSLSVPYTITTSLLLDRDGNNTWTWSAAVRSAPRYGA